MPESRWEDYVLYHMEPFFEGREQQIEIVLEQDHNLFLGSFLGFSWMFVLNFTFLSLKSDNFWV